MSVNSSQNQQKEVPFSKDAEYYKAKKGFIQELAQFHESRGTPMNNTPKISGKEVDLYLLYQIITSHGGWEKINERNEWDDFLEHFHLIKGTNCGLAIKQIYLRYLELYEKKHFLREDVDGSTDRRRLRPNKQMFSTLPQNQHSQQNSKEPTTIQDHLRGHHRLSTKIVPDTEYDRLVLSLQSPLPSDQDVAISVCTLLSNNDSNHALKFYKNPQLLNLLLGHAGIFNECSLRRLCQESYTRGRSLSHKNFWNAHVSDPDIRKLLCECFVTREQLTLCQYNEDQIKYGTNLELDLEVINEQDLTEEEKAYLKFSKSRKPRGRKLIENTPVISPAVDPLTQEKMNILKACCVLCCCQEYESGENAQHHFYEHLNISPSGSEDKIGHRILQISNILHNLSFEEDNTLIMASNPSMLRFLLVAAHCSWGQLSQLSYDMIGNMGKYIKLHEPTTDPISSMMVDLIVSSLYSNDRFKILRSLETLRELAKMDDNKHIIIRYFEKNMYGRLAELLTVRDIMMLICTLECLLALTNMGEAVCNDLVSVPGSVSTLVSLVSVEAQSYIPNGIISMKVMETGTGTSVSQSPLHGSGTTVTEQTINAPTPKIKTPPVVSEFVNSPQPSAPVSSSSRQMISTGQVINGSSSSFPSLSSSTPATGTIVIPPTQTQISTGFNYTSSKSMALPAATTPVFAVPMVPSRSTFKSRYPIPSRIYDGSNLNSCTIGLSKTSKTTTVSQYHLPSLKTISSSTTTSCPTVSPTSTPTSFQAILRNGLTVDEFKKADLNPQDCGTKEDGRKRKMMLSDLLERTVHSSREVVNGLVNRGIRISDKGLKSELVDNKLLEDGSSNSSWAAKGSAFNINRNTHTNHFVSDSQDLLKSYSFSAVEAQLGLKRTHSQSQLRASTAIDEDTSYTPPCKKAAISVNGNGCVGNVEQRKLNSQSSINVQKWIENVVTSNSSYFTNDTAAISAFHVLKRRQAMQFINTKELRDDNEGPVTKSIRLTSALILRNLVQYSDVARKMCSSYESHFSAIAMSNVESSKTVAQILYDTMNKLGSRV